MDERAYRTLVEYLERLPAVSGPVYTSQGVIKLEGWWVSFRIDVDHPQAWRTLQEIAYPINGMLADWPGLVFAPTSPGPWKGGPRDFLSWTIRSEGQDLRPGTVAKRLADQVPEPFDEWPESLD